MRPQPLQIVGIVGDPISHSLSPAMHNASFRKRRLPFVYLPFRVRPAKLRGFLKDSASWKHLRGFNVTIPHKEKILPFLDRVSPEARVIGAVNTVMIAGGRLLGFNTDAAGWLRSLKEDAHFSPARKSAVVLGAGGAARAVVYALAKAGAAEIAVANRTPSRARALAREFAKKFPRVGIAAIPFTEEALRRSFETADLVVNTTSVGLGGTRFSALPLASLPRRAVVSDLVYRPRVTPLLREAKRRGLKIHHGTGMLLHQGVLAAKLWTKKNPDVRAMQHALLDGLRRT